MEVKPTPPSTTSDEHAPTVDLDRTFNKLRRRPIDEVDKALLESFNMPGVIIPVPAGIFSIELDGKIDWALLHTICQAFHWEVDDYLRETRVEWFSAHS